MAHWFCRLYTFGIHQMKKGELRSICIFLYFAGIRRKGSYILLFFSEREYDDTLFPDNG